MTDVVIVDAVRTPIGRLGGALSDVRPDDMAALVIKALVERTNVPVDEIEEIYFGCANQAGEDNRNVARMATLLAGLPESIPAVTFNRLCASSLNTINQAARNIKAGEGEIYIAGGVESMTRAPYVMPKAGREWGVGHDPQIWDTTLGWRFPNKKMMQMFPLEAMGETAENINARLDNPITREEQDQFSIDSHQRAIDAINNGYFDSQIIPVEIPQRKGDPVVVRHDEHPRYEWQDGKAVIATSIEQLAKLRPVFREGGTVTAGNASGLNDGAAAVLLMSAEKAEELGMEPVARWLASGAAGVDPRVMGLGPVPATRKALQRAGLTVEDLDLIELNEAFALQALAVMRELGLPHHITNVNGGAVALGHPLGCSGARIMTTLLHEMKRRQAGGENMRFGLATMCVGVGQGEAAVVELL
ncbi:MAG: acetyl-CoA C-acyltransferase [Chloroflexi bacterium]|nr:acetyl-CoA C-acyltransferase [Chloroflexota bacterium]